jgi:hypothetical protein
MSELFSVVEGLDGAVGLLVEDIELMDFLDDHFTETLDIEPAYITEDPRGLWFDAAVGRATVERAMAAMDPAELRRIYLLNNPS